MTRPPELPLPVPFPVYGLADMQSGDERWLILWNDWTYLWTVSLCHYSLGDAAVIVESIRKQGHPRSDCSPRQIGLDEAAIHAVHTASDRTPLTGKGVKARRWELLQAEVELIDRDEENDTVTLSGWSEATVLVDGKPFSARARDIGALRAVAIDTRDVVIAICMPVDHPVNDLTLVDVRPRLDDYRWPSVREHMAPRRDVPPAPTRHDLLPLHEGLADILANAQDVQTDPRELLARIEHVADNLLHEGLARLDNDASKNPSRTE